MPKGSRCLVRDGGCGTFAAVSRPSAPRGAHRPAVRTEATPPALTWDPPSAPHYPRQTNEPCPKCGKPLAGSRTLRGCLNGHQRVAPRGVQAPYERGAEVTRAAKSEDERDAEGRALEARRQRLTDELDELTADKRLTSEARGVLKWYRAEVDKAKTMARLGRLVGQFRGERLQRTGWLTRPVVAEIEPPDYDGAQGDDDWEDDDEDGASAWEDVRPQRMTWAGAIALLGWKLDRDQDGCQLIVDGRPCLGPADRDIGKNTWVCSRDYVELGNARKRAEHERTA